VSVRGTILFYGDPHGEFAPLLDACAARRPDADAVVLLGDLMRDELLRETLAPLFGAGIPVLWVHGNWEGEVWHDRLFLDHPTGSLHASAREVAGLALGGLGGVFRDDIWLPRRGDEAPRFRTKEDLLRTTRQRWRGWLPLWHRASIFPEDVEALAAHRLAVLVCHEAPTAHPLGFAALDALAARTGAGLIVHGHHHRPYAAVLRDGTRVRGLGMREVWRLGG
jgi:predicted phosphodiesterase